MNNVVHIENTKLSNFLNSKFESDKNNILESLKAKEMFLNNYNFTKKIHLNMLKSIRISKTKELEKKTHQAILKLFLNEKISLEDVCEYYFNQDIFYKKEISTTDILNISGKFEKVFSEFLSEDDLKILKNYIFFEALNKNYANKNNY